MQLDTTQKIVFKHTLFGFIFGALFPIGATFILYLQGSLPAVLNNYGSLITIILTAPFVLAMTFFLIGKNKSQLIDLNNELEAQVKRRTQELEKTHNKVQMELRKNLMVNEILSLSFDNQSFAQRIHKLLKILAETEWLCAEPKTALFIAKQEELNLIGNYGVPSECVRDIVNEFPRLEKFRQKKENCQILEIDIDQNHHALLVTSFNEDFRKESNSDFTIETIVKILASILDNWLNELYLEQERQYSFQSAKLASIGTMAAGIGHEINNPLAIIMGYVNELGSIIDKQEGHDDHSQLLIEKTIKAGERIKNIVGGLRNFSRIDDSQKMESFSLKDCILETVEMVKPMFANEFSVKIVLKVPDKDVQIFGVFGRVQQVLMNLLVNAKDAIESLEEEKIIEVQLSVNEGVATLSVADNGPGVPESLKGKIFDAFFTTKGVNKGTGLGLALSGQIITDHKGKLILDESYSQGAKFSIYLPLISCPIENKKVDTTNLETSANSIMGCKVLIVDDEEDIAEILAELLKESGLKPTVAYDGFQALEHLQAESFDILITDSYMPRMNGAQLVRKTKDLLADQAPLIIMASGQSLEDMESDEIAPLVDAFLSKPFDDEVIINKIVNCMSRSSLNKNKSVA